MLQIIETNDSDDDLIINDSWEIDNLKELKKEKKQNGKRVFNL